ncbi:MAG: hypothetical protein JKY67_09945 [Pseudomonadales bacterium]|nr:hypothetical protein [Pseudomonadales bacterium]
MIDTPLLHKAVEYGSPLANYSFNSVIIFHSIFALIAVMSGVTALLYRKGGARHKGVGQIFVIAMLVTAASGILLDIVRLGFFVEENHTKYLGFSMPTSYPVRFAFLYAAFCLFYIFSFAGKAYMGNKLATPSIYYRIFSSSKYGLFLIVSGVLSVVLIITTYNPWTGALWMIWTFMGLVVFNLWMSYTPRQSITPQSINRTTRVFRHRTNMLAMVSFSGWGAAQSFGVAMVMNFNGINEQHTLYTGNLPGDYSVDFWMFLGFWSIFALMGIVVWVRFSLK